MNAKNPPTAKIPTEIPYIHNEFRRNVIHACANAGSAGHGKLRERHCKTPDTINIVAAVRKTPVLCSENHTICGTVAMSDDSAAPAPIATNSAGNAQQISVPPLANNVSNDANRVGLSESISLMSFCFHTCAHRRYFFIDDFRVRHIVASIFHQCRQCVGR